MNDDRGSLDGRGETPLRLRLIDVNEEREPVLEFDTTVNFLDPTEELEIAFRLVDLIFRSTPMKPTEKTKVTVLVTRPISLEQLKKYASTKPLCRPTPRPKS